ncbi:hypothetical protein D3C79_992430 [compost metagenome]
MEMGAAENVQATSAQPASSTRCCAQVSFSMVQSSERAAWLVAAVVSNDQPRLDVQTAGLSLVAKCLTRGLVTIYRLAHNDRALC